MKQKDYFVKILKATKKYKIIDENLYKKVTFSKLDVRFSIFFIHILH